MQRLSLSDLLFLKHTINTCTFFRKHYHVQSRDTQRAGIFKRFGVVVTEPTFDRCIRRCKDRGFIRKKQRTGRYPVRGASWRSSVTSLTWSFVLFMWKLGELTKEQFARLKEIFGMGKKRGPKELQARSTPSERVSGGPGQGPLAVPT